MRFFFAFRCLLSWSVFPPTRFTSLVHHESQSPRSLDDGTPDLVRETVDSTLAGMLRIGCLSLSRMQRQYALQRITVKRKACFFFKSIVHGSLFLFVFSRPLFFPLSSRPFLSWGEEFENDVCGMMECSTPGVLLH